MPKTDSLIDSGYPEDQMEPELATEMYELQIAAMEVSNRVESYLKLNVIDPTTVLVQLVYLEIKIEKVRSLLANFS